MHRIDIGALMQSMLAAAGSVAKKDLVTLKGFSEDVLRRIAQQAERLARQRVTGEIDDEFYHRTAASLARIAKKFVTAIVGLATIMMEKVWNAVIGVLWGAIEGVVGIAIPIPVWK